VAPSCERGLDDGFENPRTGALYLTFWGFLPPPEVVERTRDLFISFMKVLKSFFLSSLLRITVLAVYCLVDP
jgi:hypothetical protein